MASPSLKDVFKKSNASESTDVTRGSDRKRLVHDSDSVDVTG